MILLNALPAPVPGATGMYFYLAGTSTPATVYQTEGGTAHANPVVPDADGLFPPIWADPSVSYRVVTVTADTDLSSPYFEIDTWTPPGEGVASFNGRGGAVTLTDTDISDALGFTPATSDAATTAAAGIVQLADNATTAAGVSTSRAVTPAALAAMTSSTTQNGIVTLATTAEVRAGTVDEVVTAATLKLTTTDSADITPTANTSARAVAHGLGVKPRKVTAILRCTSADLNYAVGDEVNITAGNDAASGVSVFAVDASNVGYVIGSGGIVLLDFTTRSNSTIDAAKWKLVIRSEV